MEKKMKMTAAAVSALLCLNAVAEAQNLSGNVYDENDAPLEFANVVLLTLPDSSIVGGCITDELGLFSFDSPADASLIQVSMIGYKTVEMRLSGLQFPLSVKILPDSESLKGAVVSVSLPKTSVIGDAVVTNIAGSVLEHTGNALDVLGKVPGMIVNNGRPEVIGRGAPEYYINGRKVTDESELRNLMSEDIKSVDVVSNPGAVYGGEVRCVVRIRTVKRQGDGFGFALTSQAKQHIYENHDFEPSWSVLDLNFRKNGWDFFGKLVYWNNRNYQIGDIYSASYVDVDGVVKTNEQKGYIDGRDHNGGFQYVVGANWQINDNHSLGVKLNYDDGTFGYGIMNKEDDVFANGEFIDRVCTVNESTVQLNTSMNGNLYYDGSIDRLNINFNADFVTGRLVKENRVVETSLTSPASISTSTDGSPFMGAGKLILSHPLGKGSLQAGTEEIYVEASQKYTISKQDIPSSDASIAENTLAGFVEYALPLSFGQFSAGLRYERVNFKYWDGLCPANDKERSLNNWFPSLSFATKAGPVAMNLSYTGKTMRPGFDQMTNEIYYVNRFSYSTGDPLLESEIQRTLSFNANYGWLTLISSYENVRNVIFQNAFPYDDNGIVMIKYSNAASPLGKLDLYLNASPVIGVWNPRYTIGMKKQFFSMDLADPRVPEERRVLSLKHPLYVIQAFNTLNFKNGWSVDLDYQYTSPLAQLNVYIKKPLQYLNLAISKSFLKNEALNFRLSWNDIFNSNVQYYWADYGNCFFEQSNDACNPCVQLRVSYRFNATTSKYKGTGAGESAKSRL